MLHVSAAGAAFAAAVVVSRLLIARDRVASVGYNYELVVRRGEWWRVAAALCCHDSLLEAGVVGVLLCVAPGRAAPHAFLGQCLFAAAASAASALGLCGVVAAAAPALAPDVGAGGGGDGPPRWLAKGAAPIAAAHVARRAGAAPPLAVAAALALLQAAAPRRDPLAPKVAGAAAGALLAWPPLAECVAAPYWAAVAAFWFFGLSALSLKATRPRRRVPCVAFSHVVAPDAGETADVEAPDDDGETARRPEFRRRRRRPPAAGEKVEDDDDGSDGDEVDGDGAVGPDGGPVYRFVFDDAAAPPPPRLLARLRAAIDARRGDVEAT